MQVQCIVVRHPETQGPRGVKQAREQSLGRMVSGRGRDLITDRLFPPFSTSSAPSSSFHSVGPANNAQHCLATLLLLRSHTLSWTEAGRGGHNYCCCLIFHIFNLVLQFGEFTFTAFLSSAARGGSPRNPHMFEKNKVKRS